MNTYTLTADLPLIDFSYHTLLIVVRNSRESLPKSISTAKFFLEINFTLTKVSFACLWTNYWDQLVRHFVCFDKLSLIDPARCVYLLDSANRAFRNRN